MKILSDNIVTRDDLTKIDEKQNQQLAALQSQIKDLKLAVAGSFLLNIMIAAGICFWMC